MPTTNATTAKTALVALWQAQTGSGGLLDGVQVSYAAPGEMGALCLYGGGWRMVQDDAVAETPGVLVQEELSLSWYIRATSRPRCDVSETDATCNGVATALGVVMKANPKLAGGLSLLGIAAGQGDYFNTDDETVSIFALQVRVRSMFGWG